MKCKKPILAIEKISTSHHSLFFIATIDRYVLEINTTHSDQTLDTQFQLPNSPCTSIFYYSEGSQQHRDTLGGKESNRKLILGCSDGSVRKYDLEKKTLHPDWYESPSRDDIICLYVRAGSICSWSISSEITVLREVNMSVLWKLRLEADITCIIHISSKDLSRPSACVAFHHQHDPFIFDCQTEPEFKSLYQKLNLRTEEEDSSQTQRSGDPSSEIELMAQNSQGTVVVGRSGTVKGKQSYFITVYRVEKQGDLTLCAARQCLQVKCQPIFLDIYNDYILLCKREKIRLISLTQRKSVFVMNKTKSKQALIISAHETQGRRLFKILMGRGFDFWSVQGQEWGSPQIKIKRVGEQGFE